MRAFCRSCFAASLVAALVVGCTKSDPTPPSSTPDNTPVDEPSDPGDGTSSVSPKTDGGTDPAPTDNIAARLDHIEQVLAMAAKSSLFVEEKAEAIVSHRLGPGPGVVASPPVDNGTNVTPTPTNPPAGNVDYKVTPVTNGGTIAGMISFEGTARPPKVIKVEKTPEVCGKEDRELYEVTVNDGKLQDVVLLLEGVKQGKAFDNHVLLGPPPGTRGALDTAELAAFPGTDIKPQRCIFGAFTGVIAQSSVLRFDNLDPVKHSPHTYAVKGRVRKSLHNRDLEGKGQLELPIALKKGYKVIKLECDQHPHMQNWFRLVDNPYYAFSSADGTFKIDQIPAGTYKLIAWHPILGEQEKEVTIAADGTIDVTFEFSSKRRRS